MGTRRFFLSLARSLITNVSGKVLQNGLKGTSFLYGLFRLSRSHSSTEAESSDQRIVILRPRKEVYEEWRNFKHSPSFIKNLKEVRGAGRKRFHWIARGFGGGIASWDSEVVIEKKNRFIQWRIVRPKDVRVQGRVFFSDTLNNKGTEVRSILDYIVPKGKYQQSFVHLFGINPDEQNRENLRQFKQFMEMGEISLFQTGSRFDTEAA